MGPMKFSLNQATTKYWPMEDLVRGLLDAGVGAVGLWREDVTAYGLERTASLMRESGLVVSSLCRGGFFHRPDWLDDNRRAIDEAAALGTDTLVLVSGGLPEGSRDIDGARRHVGEAIGQLVDHATASGVRMAIEPLHPMFCSDRCVVATLSQALALAAPYPASAVGVCVDTYHLWWDDTVWEQLRTHPDRIAAFQLADWITPLPAGVLTGRGLPGTGCVDLARFSRAVTDAGYTGWTEVEVFNDQVWARPGAEVLAEVVKGLPS
jgi:sugar phosphate isomerase/epimerase